MIEFAGRGILLDIEGTTSSVRFVYDVLFPFARRHLISFLAGHWNEPEVQAACEQIARDAEARTLAAWTAGTGADGTRQQVIAEVERLMDADAKATGLKELQGLIWREGYASGRLCSHVYDDVPPALRQWQESGKTVCIYSSGSVRAQKLFFAHTEHGDLTPLLAGYYDTTTGPKKEAASYVAIARDMAIDAGEILFCSDVLAELDAAAGAGMQTALAVRPDNAQVSPQQRHPMITSFREIRLV